MCYQDKRCPLCKTEARQVVMVSTPKRGLPCPSFEQLLSNRTVLWQKPRWAGGVMARTSDSLPAPGQNARNRVPLHVRLLQMTNVACNICDPQGTTPLGSMSDLSLHLRRDHGGLLQCPTCIKAHRKFPLELETFTAESLAAHNQSAHKHCAFCDMWFFAVDEMWAHMNERHHLCTICQAAGTPHLYFKDSAGLRGHYASVHHPCREGECGDSGLVAFASEQELRDHALERHSSKMPRFKKNTARQLVDLGFTFTGHPSAGSSSSSGARGQHHQQQRQSGRDALRPAPDERSGAATSAAAGASSSSGSSVLPRSVSAGNINAGGDAGSSSNASANRQQQQQQRPTANGPGNEQGGSNSSSSSVARHDTTTAAIAGAPPAGRANTSTEPAADAAAAGHRGVNGVGRAAAAAAAGPGAAAAGATSAAIAGSSNSSSSRNNSRHEREGPAGDVYESGSLLEEGGLQIIDDDVGLSFDFSGTSSRQQQQQRQVPAATTAAANGSAAAGIPRQQQWPAPAAQPGPIFGSSSSSRPAAIGIPHQANGQQPAMAEEFPDLASAAASGPSAAAGGAAAPSSQAAAVAGPSSSSLQLVKATAKCPCGRRQMHLAVKRGERVPPLACDKDCERQQRRAQVAEAFGVADPDGQAAYWDRHRTPTYAPQLLQAYKRDPVFIEQLEQQLLHFLAAAKTPRLTLAAMAKPQRVLVHEYAEAGWGLVSHSVGSEPNRAVQLFKTASSGAPTQLLSQAAVLVSQAAIDSMLASAASRALTLRLTDVTPGANLTHALREWAGEYQLSPDGPAAFLATFDSAKAFKAASDTLAGGIRGLFRVERPRAAAGAAGGGPGSPAADGAAAAAGAAGSSSTAAAAKGASWGSAATSSSFGASSSSRVAAAGRPAAAAAGAGWQTVKGKQSAADEAAAAAAAAVDPWADDQRPLGRGSGQQLLQQHAGAAVADDWEAALEPAVVLPSNRGPAVRLEQKNMWAALEAAE